MSDSFRFMAFDPGVEGGWSFWVDGSLKEVAAISHKDIELLRVMHRLSPHVIVVEEVHASPSQASRAAFTFGREYQRILSLSLAVVLEPCLIKVKSVTWQMFHGLVDPAKGKANYTVKKETCVRVARKAFPAFEIDKSTADAVLIGSFFAAQITEGRVNMARRMYEGKNRVNVNCGEQQ